MVIKVYISGSSGNKEVKKRQQRVLLILDSKNVKYEVIDIAETGAEEAKDFMQNSSTGLGSTIGDPNPRHPLPPQIFNDDVYCGDYDMFDMANEIDDMESFLKLEPNSLNEQTSIAEIKLKNGDVSIDEKIEKVAGNVDQEHENDKNEQKNEDKEEIDEKESKTEDNADETEVKEEGPEKKEVVSEEQDESKDKAHENNETGGDGDKLNAEDEDDDVKVKTENKEVEKESSPEKSE